MREIQYKTFSFRAHQNNWLSKKPSVCEFELTFKCALHCRHCYSDCYNKIQYLRKELNTQEVKIILDKLYKRGVLWLCFTGGDPLAREDFLEIYSYAKEKGFIITIFTSGYYINEKMVRYLKQSPPFVIELTLNAINKKLYERISQVKDSFLRVKQAIKLILKAKLPLKIKTQVTQDNLKEIPKIKSFLKRLGLKFISSYILYPRLNGDLTPCNLRVLPEEILRLNQRHKNLSFCEYHLEKETNDRISKIKYRKLNPKLFFCAVGGGDGFRIDPYGNIFLCSLIRDYKFNLLKVDIDYALNKLLPFFRKRRFLTESACRYCPSKEFCGWCPGRAYLEKADMELPIEYYCRLAELLKNEI